MTETVETPGQPGDPGQPAQTTPPAQGGDWEGRYKGSVKKIDELVAANRELLAQLSEAKSQVERLSADLGLRETEKTAAVSERDRQIQDLVHRSTEQEAQLKKLKAMELKINALAEIGRPELVSVIKHIPDLEDPEALKIVLKDFGSVVEKAVKEREQQLLSGVAPAGGVTPQQSATPASDEEWERYVNSFTPGTGDKQKALDQWMAWLQSTHTRR